MAKNLPVWIFLLAALVLIGSALMPVLRVAIGVDPSFQVAFSTVVMLLIGGLMSGLSAMILLVRRAPQLPTAELSTENQKNPELNNKTTLMHASGLLLYTLIPLLNFLVAYWLWIKYRHQHPELNLVGQKVLNFQITIYLYLLLSLFMVFAFIGIFTTPLILAFHAIATVIASVAAFSGKEFNYPTNIPIIQGR